MVKKVGGRPSTKPLRAEFEILHARMKARELAEHYGVKEGTIRKWITAFNKEEREEQALKDGTNN